jgi:hypothetical protein
MNSPKITDYLKLALTRVLVRVSRQFAYSFIRTEERRHSVFYAVFRQSFAVAAVTALDRTEF